MISDFVIVGVCSMNFVFVVGVVMILYLVKVMRVLCYYISILGQLLLLSKWSFFC